MFIDKNFKKVNHEIFEKINELYQPEDLANFIASMKGEKARKSGDQWRVGNKKNGGSLTVGKDGNKTVWHDFETGDGGDVCDAYATFGNMSLSNAAQTACKKLNLNFDESYFIDPKDYIDRAKDIIESRGIDFEFVKTQNVGYLDLSICKKYKGYYIKGRCLIFGNNKTEKIIEFENNATAVCWKRTGYIRQTKGNLQFYADSGDKKAPVIAVEGEFDALAVAMCGFNAISNANGDNADYCLYDCDEKGNEKLCGKPDIRYTIKDIGVKDPNDALLKVGKEKLKERIQNAINSELKKGACSYENRPFGETECFYFPADKYFKQCNNFIKRDLRQMYKIQGRCNGRLVINYCNKLLSVTSRQLVDATSFETEKGPKALKSVEEIKFKELLYRIREEGELDIIPIIPTIPTFKDVEKSEKFADDIEETYKSYVDKNGKPSLRQYMRVMGYILSGKFWIEKNMRFFINIVAKDQGIGKTNLLADAMLKNLKLYVAKVEQVEATNNFTYADFMEQDILIFDDLKKENKEDLMALMINIISNARGKSEQKGQKIERVSNYRPIVIETDNQEFVLPNDKTGLTNNKRLLISFIETKQDGRDMNSISSELIVRATNNPGIEMAFLKRCEEVYKQEPDIRDLLCSEKKAEKEAADFDLFYSLYKTNVQCNKNCLVNIAKTFTYGLTREDVKPLFIEKGRYDERKIAGVFAAIIIRLRTDRNLNVEAIPACLKKEYSKIDDIMWSKKSYNKDALKNCCLSLSDWERLQSWLESIDPTKEDDCDVKTPSTESPQHTGTYDSDEFF